MSEVTSKEELRSLQKKEKKELLAKIQKMKHSVPKGDKKKKKEVTAETALLLADLDLKHENEMKEFEKKECSAEASESLKDNLKEKENGTLEKDVQNLHVNGQDLHVNGQDLHVNGQDLHVNGQVDKEVDESHVQKVIEKDKVVPRVSKAQKRRDKKAMLAKERSEAIEAQELENLNSLRHLELQEIKQRLSKRNLTIYEVPSDGNCLYKAVEHQLSSQNLKETTVQSLREDTSEYLLLHMNDYLPFLTCPETGDGLTEDQYLKYCEDIAKTSAWGGHIEVEVLSRVCGFPIEIIQAEGPNIMAGDENSNPKLILSYHRHAYGLGKHYNSVIPVAE